MVRVYLRRRQGTDRPFKATQGSAQRSQAERRVWSSARLRAPRRHRFPSARPRPTPTGGRRSARGARARGGDALGHQGRSRRGRRRPRDGDGLALRKLGEREARGFQMPGSRSSAGW